MKKRKSVTAHEIEQFLLENGPSTRNQIEAGIRHACVQTLCYRLAEMNLLVSDGHVCPCTGKKNKLYALTPARIRQLRRAA